MSNRRAYFPTRVENPNSGMKNLLLFGLLGFGAYYIMKMLYPNFSISNLLGFGTQPKITQENIVPISTPGLTPGNTTVTATPNSGTQINTIVNTPPSGYVPPTQSTQTTANAVFALALNDNPEALIPPQPMMAIDARSQLKLSADVWGYYWSKVTGVQQTADLFPVGNRDFAMSIDDYINVRQQHGLSGCGGMGAVFNVGPYAIKTPGYPLFSLQQGLSSKLYNSGGRPKGFTTMGAGRATGIERKPITRMIQ